MGDLCLYFLPANFQFPTPFCSQLRLRHGTDRQHDNDTFNSKRCCIDYKVSTLIKHYNINNSFQKNWILINKYYTHSLNLEQKNKSVGLKKN